MLETDRATASTGSQFHVLSELSNLTQLESFDRLQYLFRFFPSLTVDNIQLLSTLLECVRQINLGIALPAAGAMSTIVEEAIQHVEELLQVKRGALEDGTLRDWVWNVLCFK